MAKIVAYKFQELAQLNNFMAGGLQGVSVTQGPGSSIRGLPLAGTTLTLTNPAGTVTFTSGTAENGLLSLKDIKQQIEGAIAGVKVLQYSGYLFLVEATPSTGIVVDAAGGNPILGIENGARGRVINPNTGSAAPTLPYLLAAYPSAENGHVLYVVE